MKNRKNNYREVDKLPARAVTVASYIAIKGYTSSTHVYQEWKRHTGPEKKSIDFEIVLFKGINFIIPKKQKASV